MSRSRRDKDPYKTCGFEWPASGDSCDHYCRLPIGWHNDFHECCQSDGGRIEVTA